MKHPLTLLRVITTAVAAALLLAGCQGGAASSAPESSVPESSAPESSVPESSVPESSVAQTPSDSEESSTPTASQTVWRYAALGDSIPAGYGLSNDTMSYPQLLREQIGADYDRVEFANYAISGHNTTQFKDRVNALLTGGGDAQALLETADVITICIGGNNFLQRITPELQGVLNGDSEQIAANLAALLADGTLQRLADDGCAQLKADLPAAITALRQANPDVRLVIMTIYNPYAGVSLQQGTLSLPIGTIIEPYMQQLNDTICEVVEENDCVLADVAAAFAADDSGVQLTNATSSSVNAPSIDPHPTAAGHRLIAETHLPLMTE